VPDRARIRRVKSDISIRNGRRFVLGYLGIVNNQDGVDHMVRAVEHLVRRDGFTDFQAVIVGDGPALPAVQALTSSLGLDDHITLTGYLSGEALLQHISAFDVGMIPDPVNDYNDKISMNKVFEYSALGIPSVAYPLTETRRLLGGAGLYAASPDPSGLAAACLRLFHDDALREKCANAAARLGREAFDWDAAAGAGPRQVGLLLQALGDGHRPHGELLAQRALRQDQPRRRSYRRLQLHRVRRRHSGA
jgi:glycosyltransferase involved in cell wall biosynthesis